MRTIYKYTVPLSGGKVRMPGFAEIVSVGAQGDELFVWAAVETDWIADDEARNKTFVGSKPTRVITVVGTGHAIPAGAGEFLGMAFMGAFVWHLFGKRSPAPAPGVKRVLP